MLSVPNFLRILRITALTSFVCFSSSAVYAMAETWEDSDSALTYRTTCHNVDTSYEPSSIFFRLQPHDLDLDQDLEIRLNHRTPDKKRRPSVKVFHPISGKPFALGQLPTSEEFTDTSYTINMCVCLCSRSIASETPVVLRLSFQDGVSDIHSAKIKKKWSGGQVLQSVILGNTESEAHPERVLLSSPEVPNRWSEVQTLTPRLSFSSDEPLSSVNSEFIEQALSQEEKVKVKTLRRFMDNQTVPFSERLNVAVAVAKHLEKEAAESLFYELIRDGMLPFSDRLQAAKFVGERAFFELAMGILNGPENRASAAQYLTGAMKIIADRKLQEDGNLRIRRGCVTAR